ncbi:Abi family protein [soil metagenome]
MPYSIEFLADLDRTLTRGRISRYLVATGGNLEEALQLYEKNMAVSEALFGILHGVEVSIRNSLHYALSADIGVEDWYQHGMPLAFPSMPQLAFTAPMRNMLDKARRSAGPAAPVGKLVAELTFGFWPFLISGQYHNLWSASSHKAFPHAHVPRSFVHTRLETIQRLRNRIAHHEPILSSTNEVYTGQLGHPKIALQALVECVSWVSPATADWLRVTSRYEQAEAILADVAGRGLSL